jgi:hypothetical protein
MVSKVFAIVKRHRLAMWIRGQNGSRHFFTKASFNIWASSGASAHILLSLLFSIWSWTFAGVI